VYSGKKVDLFLEGSTLRIVEENSSEALETIDLSTSLAKFNLQGMIFWSYKNGQKFSTINARPLIYLHNPKLGPLIPIPMMLVGMASKNEARELCDVLNRFSNRSYK